jgi:hypothetical protein
MDKRSPLRRVARAMIDNFIVQIEIERERRAEQMPDDSSALNVLHDAHQRLMELGWQNPIFCPKDGTPFEVIEAGSCGIHKCIYMGEWPKGDWWIMDGGDLLPSRPILFRPINDKKD